MYLASLSEGRHYIRLVYVDGATDRRDSFRIAANNGIPFTGDNSNVMMFAGIAMTSLLALAMMAMLCLGKKGKYQR